MAARRAVAVLVRTPAVVIVVAAALALGACSSGSGPQPSAATVTTIERGTAPTTRASSATTRPQPAARTVPSTSVAASTATSTASHGRCRARGDLPDARCTPGATNPAVTQATIGSTICVSGWTSTVRPPTSITNPIKVERMRAYGDHGSLSDYELDHLIPLELGGAPADVRNLWPEPYAGRDGATNKDDVENTLKRRVCAGSVALAVAQRAIATNWMTALAIAAPGASPPTSPPRPAPTVPPPPPTAPPPSGAPAGATARCNDGTYSFSQHRRGTCSHHGGVAVWLANVPA
jgi:hypothetical protein